MEQALAKETTLIAWFKANQNYPEARDVYYQDFPTKFVFSANTRKWTPRQRGFSLGCMYYVSPKANDVERFYLWLLLTAVKGATSFEDLVIYISLCVTLTVTVFITQFSHPKSLVSYLGLQVFSTFSCTL